MKSHQKGFTLIELVVVIVILGILAATALPRFVDLATEARIAAVQGVAAAATSGFAINYGARKAAPAKAVAVNGSAATVCAAPGTGLSPVMTGGLPAGYTVAVGGTATDCSVVLNDGLTGTCTVSTTATPVQSATVTYICVQ